LLKQLVLNKCEQNILMFRQLRTLEATASSTN